MGLLNNVVPFSLTVWGQLSIPSGLASILNATTPLWTVLVAGLALPDEPLSGRKLGGVAVGLLGVALMISLDALRGLGAHVLAQLAVLAGALSYAFAGVFGRRFRRMGVDSIVTATGQVTATVVVLAPVTFLVEQPWTLMPPSAVTWGAVVGLAALSTAVAYVLYFLILERAGATNLLLVTFLIPVSAILLGAAVLNKRLSWTHGLGMLLIGAGLAAIDGRLLRGCVKRRTVRDP
jgi:drug/metabolite transporter (DMT)-like permease